MKIEKHINNLEKYCEDDIDFRSQTAEEEKSDFDIFCDNHIADIKAIIQELKNTQSDLYEANNRIADFVYYDNFKGQKIVEDTKGYRTEIYKLKKKIFEYKYPDLEIKEV